jgi:S-adenosylmethionine synthetase
MRSGWQPSPGLNRNRGAKSRKLEDTPFIILKRKKMNYKIFASESVGEGHPDKICDQVSDAIVDEALRIDPKSRVAVETLVTTNKLVMAGEVTCGGKIDYEKIARNKIKEIGFVIPGLGFDNRCEMQINIHQQSPDIALGVDEGGAGDQGMMFGYACRETEELMPLPLMLAHDLVRAMDDIAKNELKYLRPDGKSEVVIAYENGMPKSVEKIILAKPHDQKVDKEEIRQLLYKKIVVPALEKRKLNIVTIDNVVLNGTSKWEIGGPSSDTGVTGRKIVVDSYGGMARIGGGAFSGKDPTKVDRSGAYAARFIAKNIVAAGLADRCEVQLAYVIGYPKPVAKAVETFGTEKKEMKVIENFAWDLIDVSVLGILKELDLRRPIYCQTARYGHFGNPSYSWEKIK